MKNGYLSRLVIAAATVLNLQGWASSADSFAEGVMKGPASSSRDEKASKKDEKEKEKAYGLLANRPSDSTSIKPSSANPSSTSSSSTSPGSTSPGSTSPGST